MFGRSGKKFKQEYMQTFRKFSTFSHHAKIKKYSKICTYITRMWKDFSDTFWNYSNFQIE